MKFVDEFRDAELGRALAGEILDAAASRGAAGLGLYFCRTNVEKWGGAIGYEARSEGGSRFWLRFVEATGS